MIARFNRRMLGATAAMAGLVVAGVAIAQVQPQPQQPQPQPGQQQPGQQPGQPQFQQRQGPIQQRIARPATQANMTDAQLAAWLLVDNHGEVAVSRLAQQRASSDDVKRFATQMVEDHSQFIDKLQPFAGRYAQTIGNQAQIPRQDIGQDQRQPGVQPGAQPARATGGLDIVELKQRLGQKCLESTRSELEKKEGAEFDRCFAGQQAMMHMVVLDTLEVFRNYASPELRPVLEEGIRTTEEHLKHAKDLAESTMKSGATGGQARRDDSGGRRE